MAVALIGNLGAEARAQHFGSGTADGFEGRAIYSDAVVFSGPGSDPVLVGINLHFGGSVNTAGVAIADATARAIINGTFVGIVHVANDSGAPDCTGTTFSGLGPCGTVYNTTLHSTPILVPQDVPINFELDLSVDAFGVSNGASATSLFSDTFGFIPGGPVFDLPAGFTADSPTSFIVGNRFLPAGPVAAAPEPSSMLLVISALGVLGMLRRRRA